MAEYFDIFISYRRNGGQEAAECIYTWLAEQEGYSVFYDKKSIREGRWDHELVKQVRICKDFILIVDRHIFDRFLNPSYSIEDDWVRKELSEVLKRGQDVVNIIPIILPNAKLPSNLPQDISDVKNYQWIKINNKYGFLNELKELKQGLHSRPSQVTKDFTLSRPIHIDPSNPTSFEEVKAMTTHWAKLGLLSALEMKIGDIIMKASFDNHITNNNTANYL